MIDSPSGATVALHYGALQMCLLLLLIYYDYYDYYYY